MSTMHNMHVIPNVHTYARAHTHKREAYMYASIFTTLKKEELMKRRKQNPQGGCGEHQPDHEL